MTTEKWVNEKLLMFAEIQLDESEGELHYAIDQLVDELQFMEEEGDAYGFFGEPLFDKSMEVEFCDQFAILLFWEDVLQTLKGTK